jgi:GTPase SAR1 family protein
MKIGLVGAPCVGKTTLAKAVAEKLNLTFIGESFDDAAKQCEIHNYKIAKGNRTWPNYFDDCWESTEVYAQDIIMFTKGIAWDLEEKERFVGDNFVTDSASPSQAASALIYNTFLEDTDSLMEFYNHQIERAENYDYLFFIPYNKNIKMEDDSRRPTNKALQKQFDLILPSLLVCDLDSRYWAITNADLDARIDFVRMVIG